MQYSLQIWEERVREERMIIRIMTIDDYDQVWHLWSEIKGFGIRTLDDSREGVEKSIYQRGGGRGRNGNRSDSLRP